MWVFFHKYLRLIRLVGPLLVSNTSRFRKVLMTSILVPEKKEKANIVSM